MVLGRFDFADMASGFQMVEVVLERCSASQAACFSMREFLSGWSFFEFSAMRFWSLTTSAFWSVVGAARMGGVWAFPPPPLTGVWLKKSVRP